MQAHEVMRDVLKRTSAKQIAAEMRLSLSLIYKWTEPADDEHSSAGSPLERVGHLVRITRDERVHNGSASRRAVSTSATRRTCRRRGSSSLSRTTS